MYDPAYPDNYKPLARKRLNAAFLALRKRGLAARQGKPSDALPDALGYVHSDRKLSKKDEAREYPSVNLRFGSQTEDPTSVLLVGHLVVAVCEAHGLGVNWDGKSRTMKVS